MSSAKADVCGGEELAEIGGRPVLQPARANEANKGKPTIKKSLKPAFIKPSAPLKLPCNQNVASKAQTKPPSPPLSPSAKAGLLTIPSKNAVPKTQPKPSSTNKQNAAEIASAPSSPSSPKISILHPSSPKISTLHSSSPKISTLQGKVKTAMKPPCSQRVLLKRANDTASLNMSTDKQSGNESPTPKAASPKAAASIAHKISFNGRKKSRKLGVASEASDLPPGSLAAARKAEISEIHAQRKLKIAHYGRKQGSPKAVKVVPEEITSAAPHSEEIRRCSFITCQSDPAHIAYHDQEWGVPVHDDKMLFQLLVLMGAQVGMDWPTILNKREAFREAFAGFDPAIVAGFNERKIQSINAEHNIMDVAKIRGVVENAKQILEIVQEFGSFDKYIWSFVNYKPIVNNYKYGRNIPVKTSKAETMSKDLVKRNFRFVGPTIMYSFMQAAGITNDHLVNCFRHEECLRLSQQGGCN